MQYKLICLDMDGVIFKEENNWFKLHEKYGTLEEGKKLTEKYLHLDYDMLVKEVVGRLWKGKPAKDYYDVVEGLKYMKGVKKAFSYFKKQGYMIAIITASSEEAALRVKKELGADFIYANKLIIKEGKLTGKFKPVIGTGHEKKVTAIKDLCKKLKIKPSEVIYIGDSDNDYEAFRFVGRPIAFNTKSEELRKAASAVVDTDNLADVIKSIPE